MRRAVVFALAACLLVASVAEAAKPTDKPTGKPVKPTCTDGQYADARGNCKACKSTVKGCAKCKSPSGVCTACADGLGLVKGKCDLRCAVRNCANCDGNIKKCVECKPLYANIKGNACVKCPDNCLACSSGDKCTICAEGFELNADGACVEIVAPAPTQA